MEKYKLLVTRKDGKRKVELITNDYNYVMMKSGEMLKREDVETCEIIVY